jgi:hypothetical protein
MVDIGKDWYYYIHMNDKTLDIIGDEARKAAEKSNEEAFKRMGFVRCTHCNGSGLDDASGFGDIIPCPECKGGCWIKPPKTS